MPDTSSFEPEVLLAIMLEKRNQSLDVQMRLVEHEIEILKQRREELFREKFSNAHIIDHINKRFKRY